MKRLEAYKHGKVFHTADMIDWLQTTAGAPAELGEAFLGAWVGLLFHDAYLHSAQHPDFWTQLQQNRGELCLDTDLVPSGWQPGEPSVWSHEGFWGQIAQETELALREVQMLLQKLAEQLERIADARKAFEPLVWVTRNVEGRFVIHCWPDLLHPIADDPEALLLGRL